MTYIFNSNTSITNEVEVKNDVGNSIPIVGNVGIYYANSAVSYSNPLPVTLGSNTVTIAGNIAIPSTVNVASSPENPVHVHLTEIGGNLTGSGIILTDNVPITGIVSVNNFPTVQNVTVINTESNPALVKFADKTNPQLDSQQRLRISPQGQQWWYVSTVDKDGDLRFVESFSGANANSYFLQNFASVKITSGTSANGSAIRASRRRHKIRPGISHQYITVHNFDGVQANTTKRLGMFTSYNGMFIECSDDLYFVVRRRLLDGTLVEDRYPRSSFNQDVLNGTGPSGFDFTSNTVTTISLSGYVSKTTKNISSGWANSAPVSNTQVYNVVYTTSNPISANVTLGTKVTVSGITPITYNGPALIQNIDNANSKVTLTYALDPGTYSSMSTGLLTHTMFHNSYTWWFDFNGGRTGNIRFGVNAPNGPIPLHIIEYAGTISEQYESAPALMDRMEIVNTGNVDFLPSLTSHGTTFNIEAEVELSPGFGVALASQAVSFNKTLTEEFAMLAVGLRAGEPYQRADLQIQGLQVVDISNINLQNSAVYQWRLVLNPTLSANTTYPTNIGKASRFWDYPTGITVTGGIDLLGGYVTSTQTIDTKTSLNFLNLGSNINYTDADIVVLVVKQLVGGTDNGSIIASINFIEAL